MFYKTNKPEAIQAHVQFFKDKSALHESAKNFAAEYDATDVVLNNRSQIFFAGLQFKNANKMNLHVWRKPSSHYYSISHLRVRATKKEHKAEWEREKERYADLLKKHFPNGEKISLEPFFNSLGISAGSLIMSGFGWFVHDGWMYIDTSLKLDHLTEILGSEYLAAQQAKNKSEKEAV